MRLLNRIFLCLLLCISVWLGGLLWFIGQIPLYRASNMPPADAIIVLTGGSGRIEYGLQLLMQEKAKKMLITGVHENISVEEVLQRNSTPEMQETLMPVAGEKIVLGRKAENTIGNAEEARYWMENEHFSSAYLVTSHYHIPRSLLEFEQVLHDVKIIPAPIIPHNYTLNMLWTDTDTRHLILSEYHKYLAARLRHWLVQLG